MNLSFYDMIESYIEINDSLNKLRDEINISQELIDDIFDNLFCEILSDDVFDNIHKDELHKYKMSLLEISDKVKNDIVIYGKSNLDAIKAIEIELHKLHKPLFSS